MPLIHQSSYKKVPIYLFNKHLQTIVPGVFRIVKGVQYERERLELPDGDFVDVDWIDNSSRQLVILSHGLEGNSDRHYIKGTAKAFAQNGWDVLAWNCRSCSGEMNRHLRLYHHGDIVDISNVIEHALQRKNYEKIVLVGFSMGGSFTLKYLGVNAQTLPDSIQQAVVFSTPCDLRGSAETLNHSSNRFYRNRFLKKLQKKISHKASQFPDNIDLSLFDKIEKWKDFDNYFSAPMNGYIDADDFYHQSSANNFIQNINIPTLIVNAKNDPILSPSCSPTNIAEKHSFVYLETPKYGGHVGFSLARNEFSWMELRALKFALEI